MSNIGIVSLLRRTEVLIIDLQSGLVLVFEKLDGKLGSLSASLSRLRALIIRVAVLHSADCVAAICGCAKPVCLTACLCGLLSPRVVTVRACVEVIIIVSVVLSVYPKG